MRKFEKYILGRKVRIQNDHKPLETVLGKPLFNASSHLQRMILQLQKYDYEVPTRKSNVNSRYTQEEPPREGAGGKFPQGLKLQGAHEDSQCFKVLGGGAS